MEPQVYMNMDTYHGLQLIQQNSDEQMQQQQQQFQSQSIIMSGSDGTPQEVIVQDDSNVVFSPMKASDQPQYIPQEQYLIQQPSSQQPQQVFYANISPQNQNRIHQQQAIALNHNIITQQNQNQQKLVLQSPKVVVQRNSDLIQQGSANMVVDHQNQQTVQYHFAPQMDQSQSQQLIIQHQPQQQIKQTIYPQQPNQVVSQPQYYLQQIQQPGVGTKIVMQQAPGNQLRYYLPSKPQQQIQQIAVQSSSGQLMQINQQPQIQTQSSPRQFRPRQVTPVRIQGVRIGSPQMQQPQTMTVLQQGARIPRPRIVRPQAQNPLHQQQAVQNALPARPSSVQQNKIVYLLQSQPDGSQVLVPHPNFNQQGQQQVVRMVQKPATPPQTIYQPVQQTQTVPQQIQQQVEEAHTPTTSTFQPKKDSDCDDLEDSITATAISKSARSEPPPLQPQSGISNAEYQKRIQQARVGVVRPMMNNTGNQLRSPTRNPAQQVIRQRPVAKTQYQPGLTQEIEVPERESAKMLVILDNGEQRLITFTLPKETCTVQELLDQVGIQVGADSNIECIENPGSEIDYIVKVGNFATSRDTAAMTKAAENHIRQQHQHRQQLIQNQRNSILQNQQTQVQQTAPKVKTPEPKGPEPKYVPGFFAVCTACGFSGVDHAKCNRCQRIFTEVPKMQRMPNQKAAPTIPGSTQAPKLVVTRTVDKKDQIEAIQKKHQLATAKNSPIGRVGRVASSPKGRGGARGARAKPIVPEVVTLSSDDESESSENKSLASKSMTKEAEPAAPKKHYEPEIVEDVVPDDFFRSDVTEFGATEENYSTSFSCRTIRIGSYKFDSKEKVIITTKGIKIVAPSFKNPKEMITLNIQHSEIVKLVVHFSKQLHIIFLYTKPSCARFVTGKLELREINDKSPFYTPMSRSEPRKKIVFLAENINEETKSVIRTIYKLPVLEEISNADANELLVRSTGIPLTNNKSLSLPPADVTLQEVEVRKLLLYPEGRGGHQVTTHDYICLGSDIYLNDVIIDFYLSYVHNELVEEEKRAKSHIFSTFFYKRLTRVTKEKDSKLPAAQKRHARVANWTKNVNLFEKDFIIIPINEQSHWFLAIICFPNLTEPHTMDTNQPIKLLPAQKRAKKKATVQIGNTTITPLSKKEETIHLGEDGSERDEAEGDDSELGSNLESEDEEGIVDQGQPVKVPCILIFDSLLGAPRNRVVATLRDYLTCEYKAKYPNGPPRIYNKSNIFAHQIKVPQQTNFTDCGLFLLQYVEQFFKDPIKDFRIPIKTLLNWFPVEDVTRKREDIAKLIDELIRRTTPEGIELPVIEFPTKDGQILEQSEEQAEQSAFDDGEYVPTEEDKKEHEKSQNGSSISLPVEEKKTVFLTKRRNADKNEPNSGETSEKKPKLKK